MHPHEKDVEFTVGILSVSTSRAEKLGNLRGLENLGNFDESARLIFETFNDRVVEYILVPDDIEMIRRAVLEIIEKADVCIITGGTGISPTDVTIEAVKPLLTKELDGFGEIFRALSYKEIGVAAILTRATAGLIGNKPVFCLPGSKKGVRLALEIIAQLLRHLVSHAKGLS